jgi:putative transposase
MAPGYSRRSLRPTWGRYAARRQALNLEVHLSMGDPFCSGDHDPLFHFPRWPANLRILEVEFIQSVPYVARSHPFVERLIGTLRREYLDRLFFWNTQGLVRKLERFKAYYNEHRVHPGFAGETPVRIAGEPKPPPAPLQHYA